MKPQIPLSGLHYPNMIARILFDATEQVLGTETINTMLKQIGLSHYINAYPPATMDRAFDFADFSLLVSGVEAISAAQGGRVDLAKEIARLCYRGGLKQFGAVAGFGQISLSFQVLPAAVRSKVGLTGMATIFSTLSDQYTELEDHSDHFNYVIHKCPVCWGRQAQFPCCEMAGTMIEEGLLWLTKQHYKVTEIECRAQGAEHCTFRIDKLAIDKQGKQQEELA